MVGDGTWLTVHELAVLFNVSDGTARNWADAGAVVFDGVEHRLKTTRIGRLGHRRISAKDAQAAADAVKVADTDVDLPRTE